ncbi:MAG: sulfite exporter TauE/SafE family protein [Actinobacteria bacterium]|nr:sulfite exporter TauE/SafE family protein [Actinomycetota bacterium]
MDFGLWFITGLLTSIHCVAMCGTMVASVAIGDSSDSKKRVNYLPHLIYNSARLASYTTVGALLGLLGSVINFGPIRGGVSIFAGLFMVIMGINMLNIFPWLRFFQIRMPKSLGKFVFKRRPGAQGGDDKKKSGLTAPLTFGLLTGLMPCGPLQAMQLFAAGSGSALRGAAAMLTFGVGTVPLLMGFGTFTSAIGHTLKKKIMKIAAVVVIVLGLVMLNRGLVLQGIPYNLNSGWVALKAQFGITEGEASEAKVSKDKGVQEVTMVIENVRFVPSVINLKKGVPVKLTIDRRESNVCSDQLAIPQLGVSKALTPFGKTVVEFTPAQEGALNLTCQMGMMQATAYVGEGTALAKGGRVGANPLFTFVAGAILGWIVLTLKNTPGFINLPKPKPAPAAAAVTSSGGSRSNNVVRLEVSYQTLFVAAVIIFALFAGFYLGSNPSGQRGYTSYPTSAPVQNPVGQNPANGVQVNQQFNQPVERGQVTEERAFDQGQSSQPVIQASAPGTPGKKKREPALQVKVLGPIDLGSAQQIQGRPKAA